VIDPHSRRYEIDPEPDDAGRAVIAAALEQLAEESDETRAPWAVHARREIVDDGIA
jgi:hypothetical protein